MRSAPDDRTARAVIQDEALQLFAERGPDAVTVRQIAAAAGVSPGLVIGDFALTLPVMLAVAIASMTSRALSYGTIYTTKLLRRGTDIDRTTPNGPGRPESRRRHAALPPAAAGTAGRRR
jgi:Bacterial regulatory proteins, tetR family